jgi:Holliday junction resolvase RusA-like endonuclease
MTPRRIVVTVPGRPPGGNALHRMGHWAVRKSREEWKAKTVAVVTMDGDPIQHAHVGITWRCKTNRRRDFDNLVSGIKPLLDGLVEAGVLVDDSTEHILTLGPFRVESGAERDETEITIEEPG